MHTSHNAPTQSGIHTTKILSEVSTYASTRLMKVDITLLICSEASKLSVPARGNAFCKDDAQWTKKSPAHLPLPLPFTPAVRTTLPLGQVLLNLRKLFRKMG